VEKIGKFIYSFKFLYIVIAVALIGGVIALNAVILKQHTMMRTLMIGKQRYDLEVADTPVQLEKGLSGRSVLPASKGMLFILAKSSDNCFWMKDMHFPLDMIWLDKNGRIIHTAANVNPSSYPNQYCSEGQPKYVIELNAGNIKCGNIRDGQALFF
jgi:hypothetical protein